MEYMIISTVCPFCGHHDAVTVPESGYLAWQNGELIQNAFPDLSAEEREMLLTGICRKCQAEIFG